MEIGILHIGPVDKLVSERVQENLHISFPKVKCQTLAETLPLPLEAFEALRKQYRSSVILGLVRGYAEKSKVSGRILGVTDVDLFVPGLNFVFGEAECPGKAAIISFWRLRPEFYGENSDFQLFVERCTKEALHELGHTFGLIHCANPFCVMHFSNSIFDTDRKKSLFCNNCHLKLQAFLKEVGGQF